VDIAGSVLPTAAQERIPVALMTEGGRVYTAYLTPKGFLELRKKAETAKFPRQGVLDWMPED